MQPLNAFNYFCLEEFAWMKAEGICRIMPIQKLAAEWKDKTVAERARYKQMSELDSFR